MPSYYTVVQYFPDPVTEERINIGVIVYGDGRVRTRFLRKWQRVQSFASGDVTFLHEVARTLEGSFADLPAEVSEENLKKVIGGWVNSVQFTPPKASLKPAEDLVGDVASRFLREAAPLKKPFRDKRAAAGLAVKSVRAALKERAGIAAARLVKTHSTVPGRLDRNHKFDLSVSNGRIFFAAQGLSFESSDSEYLEREVDSTAWAIDDVKKEVPELPLAVVVLPPRDERQSRLYSRSVHVFEGLTATVVGEESVEEWASHMANTIPAHALRH